MKGLEDGIRGASITLDEFEQAVLVTTTEAPAEQIKDPTAPVIMGIENDLGLTEPANVRLVAVAGKTLSNLATELAIYQPSPR